MIDTGICPKVRDRLAQKVFFEEYRDGQGETHIQATIITSSKELTMVLHEFQPTYSRKLGSTTTFVWRGEAACRMVEVLGRHAEKRFESRLGAV